MYELGLVLFGLGMVGCVFLGGFICGWEYERKRKERERRDG